MTSTTRYPQELRERAVRLVLEHGGDYPSEWAAIESISAKLGMTKETLRRWVRRAQVDGGLRSGVTTLERERIRELERENRELRRANEILRAASLFFSPGSSTRDRPSREVHCRQPRVLGELSRSAGCCSSRRPPTTRRVPDPSGTGASGPGVDAADPADLGGELPGLRRRQGLGPATARGIPGGPLRGGAADAGSGPAWRGARQDAGHHGGRRRC